MAMVIATITVTATAIAMGTTIATAMGRATTPMRIMEER